jgi:hypothetical protein
MTPDDAKMLRACVAWATEKEEERDLDENEEKWRGAFQNMLDRWRVLTDKQRVYVKNVFEKLFDAPTYENAFSAGKVPLGTALATPVPAVLQKPLPMRPPGRK